MNQMNMGKAITTQQKHGVFVCLPKNSGSQSPTDFRPITILNVDYKILTRILAHRLRPLLAEQLQTIQFCSVPGNSISKAVATVREAIAQAEVTQPLMCVLSLYFQVAFDTISHQYLFTILQSRGLNHWFIDRVKCMCANAVSSVQIK